MANRLNYHYIPPADPDADMACRLTDESLQLRVQPPEQFFASAIVQEVLPNGYELRFEGGAESAERIDTFIVEEQQCCPFFAFERWQEGGHLVLRILRPDQEGSEE